MKCFVAAAFGKEDVDHVYKRLVKPLLREEEFRITPRRVDEIDHNEDIDDVIIEEIRSADLCITDLTYARPSAYFEAGYAAGQCKPVIYIARSDHFRARDDDPAGNLRVHFDLQMKNIVPWAPPPSNNTMFVKRLRLRLRHVIRPLLRSRERQRMVEREKRLTEAQRVAFARLSQTDQLQAIKQASETVLASCGYGILLGRYGANWTIGSRTVKKTSRGALVAAYASTIDRHEFHRALLASTNTVHAPDSKVDNAECLSVFVFLNRVPKLRIRKWLPDHASVDESQFILRAPLSRYANTVPTFSTVAVVDSVKSREEFSEWLSRIVCAES